MKSKDTNPGEERTNWKSSGARLHHFVPQFLLRRFSLDPQARNPKIFRLDKQTGRPETRSVRNEVAISHFNTVDDLGDLPPDFIEGALSLIESRAAPLIGKLVEGSTLTQEERVDLGLFAYMQYWRTPRGREWYVYLWEQMHKEFFMAELTNPERVKEYYKAQPDGEEITVEEAGRLGREFIDDLRSGRVELAAQKAHAVGAGFMGVEAVVPAIAAEMTWTVVHATGPRFVIADHPVLIHDPTAGSHKGAGWFSSEHVVATLPLDATACLILRPGRAVLEHADARTEDVLDLNLRSYASAQWAFYGPSQAVVQETRRLAKKSKSRVARLAPVPPKFHLIEGTNEPGAFKPLRVHTPPNRVRRRPKYGEPKA